MSEIGIESDSSGKQSRIGKTAINSLSLLGDYYWARFSEEEPEVSQGNKPTPIIETGEKIPDLPRVGKGKNKSTARRSEAQAKCLSDDVAQKDACKAIPDALFGVAEGSCLMRKQDEEKWLRDLADMSYDPAPGSYNDSWGVNREQLKRYLRYTYERLREDGLLALFDRERVPIKYRDPNQVSMGRCKYLAFNTGLQDPKANGDIYACFEKRPNKDGRWVPDGFRPVGPMDNPQEQKWTNILSRRKISRANYFGDADAAQMRYSGQGVQSSGRFFDHVFLDNLARFPRTWVISLLDNLTCVDDGAKDKAKRCFREAVSCEALQKKIPRAKTDHEERAAEVARREFLPIIKKFDLWGDEASEVDFESLIISALREASERAKPKSVPYAYVWLALMRAELGALGTDELKLNVTTMLQEAIDESVSLGRRDPCSVEIGYYPDGVGTRVVTMFPLHLPAGVGDSDAEKQCNLVVAADSVTESKTVYAAKTVFTVSQAYWKARLIRRPQVGCFKDIGLDEGYLTRVGEPVGTVAVDSEGNPIAPIAADAWLDINGRPVPLRGDCLIGRGWNANGVKEADRFLDYPQLSRRQGRFEKDSRQWSFVRDEDSPNVTKVLKSDSGVECELGKGESITLQDGDQILLAPGMYALTFHQ